MDFITDYTIENYILDSKWEQFPKKVKDRAIACGVDLVTALILGVNSKQFAIGVKLAENISRPGDIQIIGSDKTFSFFGAVTALGHAANAFDIDDGHNMVKGHPGASFVATVLSAGLDSNITYQEYLSALIVSYDVSVRMGKAMQDHYGYLHSTGAYGA